MEESIQEIAEVATEKSGIDFKAILDMSIGDFTVGKIVTALVTLVICVLALKVINAMIKKVLKRRKVESNAVMILLRILKVALYIVTIVAVASAIGLDTTSFVALVSVFSLGITLAANDILADVAGGLVMVSTHPFQVGDYISTSDFEGTVAETHLNHTRIKAADGHIIIVPNHVMATSILTNYTREGSRRIVIHIGVSYDNPTDKVVSSCVEAMTSCDRVWKDPAPEAFISAYNENEIDFCMRCWVDATVFASVKNEINMKVRDVFAKNGVDLTYPHINVHMLEK